ncbi:hypothetical protein PVAND_008005 [Polypedilum vanderplanki]|uniref:RING-type E3 ubiquitin transferase n=1 Tax=Polypedilum vanderplanki TaxID=319348 RepID=A0A9J6C8W7_POLVA|nr:hypothetical protein PVAND_008005 [Polypedilum vanderplanki]
MSEENFEIEIFEVGKFESIFCQICSREYQKDDKIAKLPCGDSFHEECIKLHIVKKKECPTCKKEIKTRKSSDNRDRSFSRRRRSRSRQIEFLIPATRGQPSTLPSETSFELPGRNSNAFLSTSFDSTF